MDKREIAAEVKLSEVVEHETALDAWWEQASAGLRKALMEHMTWAGRELAKAQRFLREVSEQRDIAVRRVLELQKRLNIIEEAVNKK